MTSDRVWPLHCPRLAPIGVRNRLVHACPPVARRQKVHREAHSVGERHGVVRPPAWDEHRLSLLQHELDRDGLQKVRKLLDIGPVEVDVRLRCLGVA